MQSRRILYPEDVKLAQDVREGNLGAREHFARRMKCVPAMLRARNRRMGSPLDPHELEDVVQDTLIAVWRKLPEYRGESTLESWVHPFCVFEHLGAIRIKRRRAHKTESDGILAETPMEAPETDGDMEALHQAMAELNESEAMVLRLKHFEQLTFEELADRLEISVNTVKTQYYRGLMRLRARMNTRRS